MRAACILAAPSAVTSYKEAATGPYHRPVRGPQNIGTKVCQHVCVCQQHAEGRRQDGCCQALDGSLSGWDWQLLLLCVCDKALYHAYQATIKIVTAWVLRFKWHDTKESCPLSLACSRALTVLAVTLSLLHHDDHRQIFGANDGLLVKLAA